MSLDVRYMLTGTPVRMRYTNRWATSRVGHPENVAEHSWFVSFYALMIFKWFAESVDYNTQKLMEHEPQGSWVSVQAQLYERTVLHDIEECRTGDIHRPFKYSHPDLKTSMDRAADVAAEQVLIPLFKTQGPGQDLVRVWKRAKHGFVGRIVSFADYLCVLSFLKQEGPNVTTDLCLDTLPEHAKKFDLPEYDFIRPLVLQACDLTDEIFREAGATDAG